jgi:hypothetical protein
MALAFPGLATAQITLYGKQDFLGRAITTDDAVANLRGSRLDDRASSVSVRGGTWQLCSEPNYRGTCVTAAPGDYPSLRALGLNNTISSVREVYRVANRPRPEPLRGVVLYDAPGFSGRSVAIDGTVESLDRFNDRARSVVVYDGEWELCEHARFRGGCTIVGPGRHASLGWIAGDVSSLRPVGGTVAYRLPDGDNSRVVLYEGSNFRGRSMVVDDELVSDMRDAGIADRASSARVEGGPWVLCSDPGFQGQCWSFGPGEYPVLPSALADNIASGRRDH